MLLLASLLLQDACLGTPRLTLCLALERPSQAEAFAALVLLMQERGLRKFYVRSMSLLQVRALER